MERRSRVRYETLAFVFIVLGIAITLNALAARALTGARIDLTHNELYTLSHGTRTTLGRLQDDLTISVYWTPDQPAPANEDERLLRERLEDYVSAGNGKVQLHWVRVANDNRERQTEADNAGCSRRPIQVVDQAQQQAQAAQVYRCVTFAYRDKTERLPFVRLQLSEGMEYELTSIIKKMVEGERVIGFLTGHGEPSPDTAMPYLSRFLSEEHLPYSTRTVDLRAGQETVPSDIKGLVIMNPSQAITEPELRQINAYLMRGGAVAVFASGVNITGTDIHPTGTPATHGLNALLEGYGVTINSDIVLDAQGSDTVQQIEDQPIRVPLFTYPTLIARRGDSGPGIDTAHYSVFRLRAINLPYASSITLNRGRAGENNTTVTEVGRTSSRSVTVRSNFDTELDPEAVWQRRNSLFRSASAGSYLVAVAIEGQLRSAFTGPTPATGDAGVHAGGSADTPSHAPSQHPARLLVMSSGKLFNIEQLRALAPVQGGVPVNIRLLENVFDWLSQDTDLLAVRAKNIADPPLGEVTDVKKQVFKWGSIVGLPLLVGLLGVFILRARAAARRSTKL